MITAVRARVPVLTGVYIHLPYCDVKCAYCDFYSIADRHVSPAVWQSYLVRLKTDLTYQRDILQSDQPHPVLASVFFGGGTPSRAPATLIAGILEAVFAAFPERLARVEITAEANPESLTDSLLAAWAEAGINRVSVGMQSLDETVLRYLGRLYNARAYATVLNRIRAHGIQSMSADFITGVPGQTARSTLRDLAFALGEGVQHLSLYQLTLEPGTLLKQRVADGRLAGPSDLRQQRQMAVAADFLRREGFNRYEISNFAKPGFRSVHNRIYWTGRPYLGLGVAAHGFTGKRRFFHARSLEAYLAGKPPGADQGFSARDNLINLFRLKQRMPVAKILRCFEPRMHPAVLHELMHAAETGWLILQGKTFEMEPAGMKFTDSLIARLWNL